MRTFKKMPFFIEVGACDFDTCEQLIENGWRGIVIEPVKYYFNKLPKWKKQPSLKIFILCSTFSFLLLEC